MSEWRVLRVAIWREIYSRRKGFAISTALVLFVVIGGLFIGSLALRKDSSATTTVAVLDADADALGHAISQAIAERQVDDTAIEVTVATNRTASEADLRTGDLSALVVGPREVLWGPSTTSLVADLVAGSMRAVYVETVAADIGISTDETLRMLAPIEARSIEIESVDEGLQAVSVVTVILIFIAIIAYGQWIAYGVVEEKANRVAEVVLGALSPSQLLAAKLVSLGGLGVAQLSIVGAAGLFAGLVLFDLDLPPVTGEVVLWVLVWFILGYALYGALYAAAGSLAADTQEAGNAIGPLNILPGLGYMTGVIAFSSGNDLVPRILSLIPIWTPFMMPGRMAQGLVPWWEIGLSMVLMAVATALTMRLAARVYLGGITQATRSVGWRQAFRGGTDFQSGTPALTRS